MWREKVQGWLADLEAEKREIEGLMAHLVYFVRRQKKRRGRPPNWYRDIDRIMAARRKGDKKTSKKGD